MVERFKTRLFFLLDDGNVETRIVDGFLDEGDVIKMFEGFKCDMCCAVVLCETDLDTAVPRTSLYPARQFLVFGLQFDTTRELGSIAFSQKTIPRHLRGG